MEAYFPIGPVWTVAVEFQFYLLFPFIFAAYRAHGASRLALLILLVIATRLLLAGNSSDPDFHLTLYFTLIGRLDQFLLGMLLATYYYRRPHSPLPPLRCLMTSILTLAVFTAYFAHRGPPWLRQSLEPTIEAPALCRPHLPLPACTTARLAAARPPARLAWRPQLLPLPVAHRHLPHDAQTGVGLSRLLHRSVR